MNEKQPGRAGYLYQIQFVSVRDPLILGYSFSLDEALFDHFRPSVINITEIQNGRK